MMRWLQMRLVLVSCLALSVAGAAAAQPPRSPQPPPDMDRAPAPPAMNPAAPNPPSEAELLQRMTVDLDRRLELSDQQLSDIRPILQDYLRELATIRGRLRAEELTTVRALQVMRHEGEKAADRIAPILTPSQAAEYEQLRAEQRSRVAAEIQAQSGGAGPP